MAELKEKVVRGFAWNVAERIASLLFQAWVMVIIVNRIPPDLYAVKGILAPLVAVFNIFVDSGFSQALMRNPHATQTDYSSAFWFNVAIAAVVYGALVGVSWPLARLLEMPEMVRFAPVFFLIVPLGALGIIQQTVLAREFDFRRISTIFFVSNVGSGLVGVALAWGGFGFWAIVGQRVSQTALRSALFWAFGRWRPQARFSAGAIRSMFGFSSRLLATDLVANIYAAVPNFIIPRLHDPRALGIYDNARSLRDVPLNSTMTAMQSVTFPALASIRTEEDKFSRAVGRVVGSVAFLMFPMMAGLVAVSDEIFALFLAPHWQPSAPFFRILCLAGFATPLAMVSSNILRSRSDGRDVLRSEIVKKVIATVILASTVPFGVVALAWGVVGVAWSDAAVSFTLARRQSAYGFRALARDVLPVLGLTVAMTAAVWAVGALAQSVWGLAPTGMSLWLLLGLKVATGVVVWFAGARLLRLAALGEFMEVLRKMAGKIGA